MENQLTLTTPRLLLKGVTPAFIRQSFREKSVEEIKQLFGCDDNGFNRLTDMNVNGMEMYNLSMYYFVLLDKLTNKIIGECGFHSWNKTHKRAELFYNLKSDSDKRKGLISEAVSCVLDFGFNTLQLHRVEALTADYNIASIKVLERFGFTKEGTMREDYVVNGKNENSECYSLLKWEWSKHHESGH